MPAMRTKMARMPLALARPQAMMMPATMNENSNSSIAPAMPATACSALLVRSATCACLLRSSAGRSAEASSHTSWMRLPTSGQSATPGDGAGTLRVPARTLSTASCSD